MMRLVGASTALLLIGCVVGDDHSLDQIDGNTDGRRLIEQPIDAGLVLFGGMSAGDYNPARLLHWNKYAYSNVIAAAGTGLANVYATEILELSPGQHRLLYGGWDTNDPLDHTDRILTASSNDFLSRSDGAVSPPQWSNRRVTLTNNVGWVANDPTAVILRYPPEQPTPHVFALYSAAANDGTYVQNAIAWAITDRLELDGWYPADRPTPGTNFVAISNNSGVVNFAQRPSLVYDQGRFLLYYDQGGIAASPNAEHDCGPEGLAVNDCSNVGFNIHVAESTDGKNYVYRGKALQQFAGAPEVERFAAGFVMFYDNIPDTIQYALSPDGIHFEDHGPVSSPSLGGRLTNPDGMITNVNILRQGDRLLGILFGEFPRLSDPRCADSVYSSGQWCIDRGVVNAYFLQKYVVFVGTDASGRARRFETAVALDEDRLELKTDLAPGERLDGDLQIFDTDASTLLYSGRVTLSPNTIYILE